MTTGARLVYCRTNASPSVLARGRRSHEKSDDRQGYGNDDDDLRS